MVPRRIVGPMGLATVALLTATLSRYCEARLGLPRAVDWLHFPIVVAALLVSLPRLCRTEVPLVAAHLALLAVFFASAWVNGTGAINAALGYILLAEPLLLYAALLGAEGSAPSVRSLGLWLLALALVQIPTSLLQLPASLAEAEPDLVQGTFQGMGTGHHVMGAVALSGALYLDRAFEMSAAWLGRIATGLLLVLPIISDSKQVMLAYFLAYVTLRATQINSLAAARRLAVRAAAIMAVLYIALWAYGLHQYLQDSRYPGAFARKLDVFALLAGHFVSPVQWLVGVGPGHGVGRLAGWLFERYWSVLEPLGATRTGVAAEAWAMSEHQILKSSLFIPLFSWAGVFGEIGLAGLAAYVSILWLAYRRAADDLSRLLLLAVVALGFLFDWLEQYNFMLYVLAVVAQRSLHGSERQRLSLRGGES